MRKSIPFVATALVSVMITAGIMQASAGAQITPRLRATGEPASRVLGLELSLDACDPSPDNAAAWTRFAKCSTGNFAAIKKWATKMDKCMMVYQVERRNNFARFDRRHHDNGNRSVSPNTAGRERSTTSWSGRSWWVVRRRDAGGDRLRVIELGAVHE